MTTAIRDLEPKAVWNYFSDLNAVPRPSKQEERVIAFMMEFGESLGLETKRDEIGNVLIKKPGTTGKEDHPIVAIQSHLDMVHQKNASTEFDFQTQGIEMYHENDWVKAKGTTLGADNGIGVACAMAILAADDLEHPPIEALFTIDEETGMTGAKGLKGGLMDAKYLLNLDTEDDDELCIGCAGGVDVVAEADFDTEGCPEGYSCLTLSVTGLTGGHSGMDIHLGRGNANKIMNRALRAAAQASESALRLSGIDGGGLRNAIPRESTSQFCLAQADVPKVEAALAKLSECLRKEYATTDPDLSLRVESQRTCGDKSLSASKSMEVLRALYSLPNGIYRLSPEVEGLVQTSSNLARVVLENGHFKAACLVRGSVDSEKLDMAEAIACALEQIGAQVSQSGEYPGWAPKPESEVVKVMTRIYSSLFQEAPHVIACHAGLECGILGTNYPDMEMISFGPNIRGAHSPDERVQVSSVQKTWKLLTTTLAQL